MTDKRVTTAASGKKLTYICPHGHTVTSGETINGKIIKVFRHRDCKGTITRRIYNPELIAHCANCEWKTTVGLAESGKTLGYCECEEVTK